MNRVVPASVTLDRSMPVGRDRDKKDQNDAQRKNKKSPAQAVSTEPPGLEAVNEMNDLIEPEKEKTKGKNLDINV